MKEKGGIPYRKPYPLRLSLGCGRRLIPYLTVNESADFYTPGCFADFMHKKLRLFHLQFTHLRISIFRLTRHFSNFSVDSTAQEMRNPYRNLKSENSQDYVQKPQEIVRSWIMWQVPCEPHLRVGRGNHGGGGQDALGERGKWARHQRRTVRTLRQRFHLEAETGQHILNFSLLYLGYVYLQRRNTARDQLRQRVIKVVLEKGQCCRSGMFIQDPIIFPSRIQGQKDSGSRVRIRSIKFK